MANKNLSFDECKLLSSRLIAMNHQNGYKVKPQFYVINFDDPRRSHRSLSRLSSALSAKASTLRSYMLDHNQNCIFIHSSRTDSVLCSLVAGISWFFLVCFYWIINFT